MTIHALSIKHTRDKLHGLDEEKDERRRGIIKKEGEEISYVPTSYFHLVKEVVKTYTEW